MKHYTDIIIMVAIAVAFGFVNGWLWSWGAVCGICGHFVLIKITKQCYEKVPPVNADPK